MREATKRRTALADFVARMVKEQPLGVGGGIVVVLLILVAVLADVLAPYGFLEVHLRDRLQGSSAQYPAGHRPVGAGLVEPRYLRGSAFDSCRSGGHQYQCRGGSPDRRHFRIPRWQVRLGCAEICRCLDGIPGTAHIVDDHVPGRARRNTDNSCSGYSRRHRRLESGEGRGCRHKGECLFSGRRGDGRLEMASVVRHVLPNIMPVTIIIFSINIGGVMISEASLSFLGFGLPPTVPSWGGLLSREGREYMERAPWLAVWPGLCLTITVFSLNMFGDALRDLLDPRLRGGGGRLGALGAGGGGAGSE